LACFQKDRLFGHRGKKSGRVRSVRLRRETRRSLQAARRYQLDRFRREIITGRLASSILGFLDAIAVVFKQWCRVQAQKFVVFQR
jgi:hypothetical protein